jgi:hypothetical protein
MWAIRCVAAWHDSPQLGHALWHVLFGLRGTSGEVFKFGTWAIMCNVTWHDFTWYGLGCLAFNPYDLTGLCICANFLLLWGGVNRVWIPILYVGGGRE